MKQPTVSFEGNQVTIGELKWLTPYPIEQCVQVGEKIVAIYERPSEKAFGQFHNLEAFDLTGNKLWTAEHPTSETADLYVQILEAEPLTVLNFAGFRCHLDLATGKILKKTLTK